MDLLVDEEEVADEVETHVMFLVTRDSFSSSYVLQPDLLRVLQSDHGSSTSLELHTAACDLHEIFALSLSASEGLSLKNRSPKAGPDPGAQDEGQTGSNPDEQPEGQARPDPGNAETSQPMPSYVVHAGLDLEHIDLDVADVSTQPPPEQMDEGFTATTYPKVQENLKLTVEEHVLLEEPASSLGTLSSLQHLTKDLTFVFILPSRVLLDIEQIMRSFLWSHGSLSRGKAKIAWEVVCLPKKEGGLGVRRLDHFNKALMVSHIWKLLSLKESLWVKWIHIYKLRNRSFLDIPYRGKMSWGWRKLLKLRPIIREFICFDIGDGSKASMWFDMWCSASPLCNVISFHDIARASFSLDAMVHDCIHEGGWNWPSDWLVKYPSLNSISILVLNIDKNDVLELRNKDGTYSPFSVQVVWESIRPRDLLVP
nr:hypothetical protein [Tanacetum cinerariifolium]